MKLRIFSIEYSGQFAKAITNASLNQEASIDELLGFVLIDCSHLRKHTQLGDRRS
jgi:hypothetical protein